MKKLVWSFVKAALLMHLIVLTAYGQPSKSKQPTANEEVINLYKDAYYLCKIDFDTCQNLVNKQSKYIHTLESIVEVQKQRLTKFEELIYRASGRKRKAFGMYFYWKRNRKNF